MIEESEKGDAVIFTEVNEGGGREAGIEVVNLAY